MSVFYAFIAILATLLIVFIASQNEIVKYVVLAVIYLAVPISAGYCGNELFKYYGAEGGVVGFLQGLYDTNKVNVVDELAFKIENTEFKLKEGNRYSIEIVTSDVMKPEIETKYNIYVNGLPCYDTFYSHSDNIFISAKYQYNFYNSDRGLKANDELTINVSFYENYTRLVIDSYGGEDDIKNWNSYFNKNNFVVSIEETTYEKNSDLEYGNGEVPEVCTVKFLSQEKEVSKVLVFKGSYLTSVPKATLEEHLFVGWSIDGQTVVDPLKIKIEQDTTFKAVFEDYKDGLFDANNKRVYSWEELIGEGLVKGTSKLTFVSPSLKGRLKLPETIKELGADAFSGCKDLTKIECTGVEVIASTDYRVFYGCLELREIVFSNSLKTLDGMSLFDHCDELKTLTIPSSVTSIGKYVFEGYHHKLTEVINYSKIGIESSGFVIHSDAESRIQTINGVDYYVYGNAFTAIGLAAPDVVSATLSSSCNAVRSWAFSGCSNLQSIDMSKTNITSLGGHTFYNSAKIVNIRLPNTLTTVLDYDFAGVTALRSLYFASDIDFQYSDSFLNCDASLVIYFGPNIYYNPSSHLKYDESGHTLQYKKNYTYEQYLAETQR